MVGPENSIFRKLKSVDPKKMPLTTEISLHFYFPFTAFPENVRERARARERRSVGRRDCAVDRYLVVARARRIEIAIDGERGRSEIAISPIRDRDLVVDRDRAVVVVDDFFLSCGLCFSGFVFSFFFSKHQKIFSGKFFEMQPNTWKYFPFPENSISEKYVFSGKRFTATILVQFQL